MPSPHRALLEILVQVASDERLQPHEAVGSPVDPSLRVDGSSDVVKFEKAGGSMLKVATKLVGVACARLIGF